MLTQFPFLVVPRKEFTQISIILVSHGKMQHGIHLDELLSIVQFIAPQSPWDYQIQWKIHSGKWKLHPGKGMLKTLFWKVETNTSTSKSGEKKKAVGKAVASTRNA